VRLKEGKRRVQDGPYADTKEQLADHHPGTPFPLTPPSNGQRDARERQSGQLKSARWHLKPSVGGSQGEWNQSGGRAPDHRAVARESYGRLVAYLSVHTHDLASAEDALSDALVSGAQPLATGWRARKTPRLAADSGASFAHRRHPSSTRRAG